MRSFRRLTLSTLWAVYVLILVGGIVRATGSGMGCPDWPRCFGNWVPPTSVEELPDNYKQIYSDYRHKKNERFAQYLRLVGLGRTADQILNDESIRVEADFNPTKTWIEYFNRIVGVTIGLLIFAVFLSSIRYWKSERTLTITAFATFLLVGFQGWIGSVVVSTNLTPWTITLHMFLALVIVAMLVYLLHRASFTAGNPDSARLRWWLIGCIIALLVQVFLGTQLREAIDRVSQIGPRAEWLDLTGGTFIIHRTFSWLVLILHAGLVYHLVKTSGWNTFAIGLIVLILGTLLTGIGMSFFAVPAFLQPVHLLLATLTFGVQFMLLLRIRTGSRTVIQG